MPDASISSTMTIAASAAAVFATLADPSLHPAISGDSVAGDIGWVRAAIEPDPLTTAGQVFRMAMSHSRVPGGDYETVNRVLVIDPPRAISWETGYDAGQGDLRFSGWLWRYDLVPVSSSATTVTLTYDWSAVKLPHPFLSFPPFPPEHLARSLARLAQLMESSP